MRVRAGAGASCTRQHVWRAIARGGAAACLPLGLAACVGLQAQVAQRVPAVPHSRHVPNTRRRCGRLCFYLAAALGGIRLLNEYPSIPALAGHSDLWFAPFHSFLPARFLRAFFATHLLPFIFFIFALFLLTFIVAALSYGEQGLSAERHAAAEALFSVMRAHACKSSAAKRRACAGKTAVGPKNSGAPHTNHARLPGAGRQSRPCTGPALQQPGIQIGNRNLTPRPPRYGAAAQRGARRRGKPDGSSTAPFALRSPCAGPYQAALALIQSGLRKSPGLA